MGSFKTIIGGSNPFNKKDDKTADNQDAAHTILAGENGQAGSGSAAAEVVITPHEGAESGAESSAATWKTQGSPYGKPVVSYATRVSGAFALIAAMTVLILVSLLAVVWDNQFQSYTRTNIKSIAQSTANAAAQRYNLDGYWSPSAVAQVASASTVFNGVGIQLLDENDVTLYDDTWISSGKNGDKASVSLAPRSKSIEYASVISSTGEKVGTIKVWAFGNEYFLTKSDIAFRAKSYQAIFFAAIIAVVLAVIVGFFFSRSLVKPVRRMAVTAEKIKNGDLTARTGLTGDDEIAQLGAIFDAMANSLENDLELERRLTTDVAHELRTPLMAILATVEAIQDGVFPADEERLATIGGETRRLSRLVDALLQLSRLESGATKFSFQPTDIVELAHSIVISHEAMVADAEMTMIFKNETGRDMVTVELDPDKIRQAVINLVSNAVRYTDTGGTITVSVGQDKRQAWIAVSDTGIGIAKEDLDRVFGRFWRAEESRNRAQGGLGVGLSVTKEVIQRHKGYIQVESEVGVGTTFTIFLPKVQPSQKRNPDQRGDKPGQTGEFAALDPSVSGVHDFTDIREAAREKSREERKRNGETVVDDDGLIG